MRIKLFTAVAAILSATTFASYALPPKPGVMTGDSATRSGCEKRRDRGLYSNPFPTKGEQRAVVILVEFSDLGFSIEEPNRYFSRMLNEEGFSDHGATGSVRDYYTYCSNGQFDISFDVYGPVRLKNGYVYYGADRTDAGDDYAYKMILDACTLLDYEIDFTEYDRNNDGEIDMVYVIYAGYGQADGGGPLTIWPHSWEITEADSRRKYYFDGKIANLYSCLNELQTDRTSARLKPQGIGPFIHEFTHVMGLPDFYATDGNPYCITPGSWSVMDRGAYNNECRTPPYLSRYAQYAFDWIAPPALTPGEKELKTYEPGGEDYAYMISTTRPDEFYIIENRQQEGNDTYLPGHGMLVWHIDFDQKIWNENLLNANPNHQRVTLVKADNLYTLDDVDGDCFPGPSQNNELSCMREPYFIDWDRKQAEFDLYDIRETDDGLIKFRAEACPYYAAGVGKDSFEDPETEDDFIYDLYGRRFSKKDVLAPGIYILPGGKKVII